MVKHVARGGGIERYTEELGSRLARRGHAVRVYSTRHYGALVPEYKGMRIVGVPSLPLTACEKLSAGLASVLHASLSPWADILHLQSIGPGAMGWLPRLRRIPAVVQFHGIEWRRARWSRFGSAVLKGLERSTVRCNRLFTAASQTQCAYFRDAYGIEVRWIPGGAEVKTAPEPREILALGLEPRRYVLFASRLVPDKGAHYLVEAFRRLDTADRLVIAGDVRGAEAYREELRRRAGNDPRIVWPGFVQGRLLEELVGHARVFVLPSDLEGMSQALLEAMGYGTCCLVSDIPENMEALGDAGAAFRRGDAGDLADRLRALLTDPSAAEEYGARAAARVREQFSWDQITDQFERWYEDILRAAGRRKRRRA
ncbi:MAG TPA: glycosyltransferase family 4 protein [Kiritimatiellia bacterium]|nr:glycosyltransferase family 4 protein [Kiritimatiellia bacterium]HRZ12352.1 glycosyltransferase family 4 protein [Kiritimatiellia bacterium]HSA17890.1 glycosyltransferase family 4 protein [Kiritimatiellia bacterium]